MKNKAGISSGKRKRAVARAVIKEGTGKVTFNEIPLENLSFFRKLGLEEPLRIAKKNLNKLDFDIDVIVKGGGNEGQIDAARVALTRAILGFTKSETLRKAFLAYDRSLLVADTRRKEPYKPGDSKARRKRQKSYR